MKIKTTREIINKTPKYDIKPKDSERLGYNYNTKWVTVDDMIDLITQLAMHPHYNPDDNVQQFMLDIKKELESKDEN